MIHDISLLAAEKEDQTTSSRDETSAGLHDHHKIYRKHTMLCNPSYPNPPISFPLLILVSDYQTETLSTKDVFIST